MNEVHVYQAIQRQKENKTLTHPRIITEVDYQNDGSAADRLRDRLCEEPQVWRLYRSVNKRDLTKAKTELIHTLIDQQMRPHNTTNKQPERLWHSIINKEANAAERCYLVDIDSRDRTVLHHVQQQVGRQPLELVNTPNGWHMIVAPFDVRQLTQPEAEVHKDGMLFIEYI